MSDNPPEPEDVGKPNDHSADNRGPYYKAMLERAEREAQGRVDFLADPIIEDPRILESFREVVKWHKEQKEKASQNSADG